MKNMEKEIKYYEPDKLYQQRIISYIKDNLFNPVSAHDSREARKHFETRLKNFGQVLHFYDIRKIK